MFKIKAQVHSLNAQDDVSILHEKGPNDVIAEYDGKRYTAIFNPFAGLYYVDDLYGVLKDPSKCPYCGTFLPDAEQSEVA
jgi:hypothetical protein